MIYQPAEDSFLMSEVLENEIPKLKKINPDLKILEIGSGSGIQLQTLTDLGIKKKNIFSCDINPDVVKHCKKMGFNCIQSDLFEKIKGSFDIIVFNPPYLPENKYDKNKDTTAGKKGNEIILKFLKQAKNYLAKNGKILLLTSSLTPKINFEKYDYKFKLIKNKKLFFEELFVWGL